MVSHPCDWALACLSNLGKLSEARNYAYHHAPQGGKGVDVYVVDSGIAIHRNHFDNRAHCLPRPGMDVKDWKNHGTKVASLIGSRKYGSAKQVTLWSCGIYDKTGSYLRDALAYIISHNNERRCERDYKGAVLSISLEFTVDEDKGPLLRQIEQQGIAIVIAAGNAGEDMERAKIFAGLTDYVKHAIVVGAIDKNYARARYATNGQEQVMTNYGRRITVFAPGKDVTGIDKKGRPVSNLDGTSFACPLVSGIVATYYSESKDMNPEKAKQLLELNAQRNLLEGLDARSPNLLACNGYLKALEAQEVIGHVASRLAKKHRKVYNKKEVARKAPPFLVPEVWR